MSTAVTKTLPKIEDLVKADRYEDTAFMVLMNQEPPKQWLKLHPTAKVKNEHNENVPVKYIPRERIEYLLSAIFVKWWVEIKDSKLIGNSVCVTVRVHVINPITGEPQWNDGIGAAPLQTDAGAGAIQFDKLKNAAVQMAAPAAETYAFKDACEKFGKLFGKDLNVRDVNYDVLYKDKVSHEELQELFELKKDSLDDAGRSEAMRILRDKEENSYRKLYRKLQSL